MQLSFPKTYRQIIAIVACATVGAVAWYSSSRRPADPELNARSIFRWTDSTKVTLFLLEGSADPDFEDVEEFFSPDGFDIAYPVYNKVALSRRQVSIVGGLFSRVEFGGSGFLCHIPKYGFMVEQGLGKSRVTFCDFCSNVAVEEGTGKGVRVGVICDTELMEELMFSLHSILPLPMLPDEPRRYGGDFEP